MYKTLKKITEFCQGLFTNFLKAFLKTYAGNSFLFKVIDVAINNLDRSVIDPMLDIFVIRIAKLHDISRAKKTIELLERAKNELDKDAYNRHVDDLLGGV